MGEMDKDEREDERGKKGAESVRGKAEETAKDPKRTRELIEEAMKKALARQGKLKEVWESLMALLRLVRAWVDGRYRQVPWQTVVLAIAGLTYFLMPMDMVPDWIVGLGFLDDVAVIGWVVRTIKGELEAFRRWEGEQGDGEKTSGARG